MTSKLENIEEFDRYWGLYRKGVFDLEARGRSTVLVLQTLGPHKKVSNYGFLYYRRHPPVVRGTVF